MKVKMLLASIIALSTCGFAQQKPIKAEIEKAIVYLQGAQLFYEHDVFLKQGYNQLVFDRVSPLIVIPSLQASTKGGLVTDVKYQAVYPPAKQPLKQYDKLIRLYEDSIEETNFNLTATSQRLNVIITERNLLLNNRLIRGEFSKDSLPLLQSILPFLSQKLNEYIDLEYKNSKETSRLKKILNRQNEELNHLISLKNNPGIDDPVVDPQHQIVVNIFSENEGSAKVSFNYIIHEAGWVPMYELRAHSTQNTIQLKYLASVYQNSQVNWRNVKLTLSTSNPNDGHVKPALSPWLIGYLVRVEKVKSLRRSTTPQAPSIALKSNAEVPTDDAEENRGYANEISMDNYIKTTEGLIRTLYEINLSYTISSGNNEHKVIVQQKEIPINMVFAAVPKLSNNAYLIGNITGWEELNLLPGNARIFMEGGYIGEVMLNPESDSDTLAINLGSDRSIVLQRKRLKDKNKTRFIDQEQIEIRTYEITIRNTKPFTIRLKVEDQIPMVQPGTNDVKVNLVNGNGAQLDDLTGTLTWELKLEPKTTKRITFTYEVRFPKAKPIQGI